MASQEFFQHFGQAFLNLGQPLWPQVHLIKIMDLHLELKYFQLEKTYQIYNYSLMLKYVVERFYFLFCLSVINLIQFLRWENL